ncbi:MAG: DEAD/DEAH box helicase family protein [Candidatus Moranbacteria bacterium]|nr:DEAD/DEAH box helicase family protein [Candidatus Moranbacteria bacterium]
MRPEEALKYLNGAMSLHAPQVKSLELFAHYLQSPAGQKLLLRMKKEVRGNTAEILAESKAYFSTVPEAREFEEYERAFPAYTFALATGVGKTRLMGAFVAYLYLVYNIQHFLIVAPNLTIYRKLYDDFSKANNPKYVFKGIQEVNTNTVKVITTENYANYRQQSLFLNQIEINIFNIQQFAQRDMTSERGITKAWETAGESYFDYLKAHDDLVVMLDEAHHYHADAALGALDLMDPLFGLEMTATPYLGTQGTGRNARQIRMKNVLYSYNLGDAIRGKLVKDPWIGTEADVDFSQFDPDSIDTDARKLQLAAFFHERAKNALKEYALENNKPIVKPVMLVVAKDTTHAGELRALIDSDNFRGGEFKGKVIEIHTKLRGDEADENIDKLISLEHPDNPVEIVIHVNMLKEGWDVTNVYTIAPLREAAAAILTEQTIGRGLRLPYGERTGIPLVDRLVLVAHEQFAKVVALAKDSPLIQGQVEQISEREAKEVKVFTEVQSVALDAVKDAITQNEVVMQEVEKQVEEEIAKMPQADLMDESVKGKMKETKTDEKVTGLSKIVCGINTFSSYHGQKLSVSPELSFGTDTLFGFFSDEAKGELSRIAKKSGEAMEERNIPIPRLMLTPHFGELLIEQFDLDTSVLRTYTNERAILEEQLQNDREKNLFDEEVPGRRMTEVTRISSFGAHTRQTPQSTIIASLLDFPLVDYDDPSQKPLLLRLAEQAVIHYREKAIDEDNLALIVESNARTIAEDIYQQILTHKELKSEGYLESDVREPKPYLEQYNISLLFGEKPVSLESQLNTFSAKLVYGQFQKACHSMYRFDSSDEVRLAYLLDREDSVEDWLRPAPNQFEGLYWRDIEGESHHRYEPDFVVEFENEIVMIEVKPELEIQALSVQAKKQTAEKYCEVVNKNIGKFGIIKPWRYVIVPTEKITISSTIDGLLS